MKKVHAEKNVVPEAIGLERLCRPAALGLLALVVAAATTHEAFGGITITPVYSTATPPTGQAVNLDAPNEGFLKVTPSYEVNTSTVISNYSIIGSFTPYIEAGNNTPFYQFQSASQTINDNNGINTNYTTNSGLNDGFSVTIANSSLPQVINAYVGGYDATGTLTVTSSVNGMLGMNVQGSNSNFYPDEVFTLPAGQGTTTITWIETAANGGADNVSFFAVTASTVPEPSALVVWGLALAVGLAAGRWRQSR